MFKSINEWIEYIQNKARDFRSAGGTREQWIAAFDDAEMRSADRGMSVRKDHLLDIGTSQPVTSGSDRSANVREDLVKIIPPAREPTKGQRTAAGHIGKFVARTVLDTLKTNDGRAWGDVQVYELDSMTRDGALAKAIKCHLGTNAQNVHNMSIRQVIKPAEFEKIRREVEHA